MILSLVLMACLPSAAQQSPNVTETRFLEFTDAMYEMGQEWSEIGCSRQADWFYGQAASAVASWRLAIAIMADDNRQAEQKKQLDEDIKAASEVEIEGFDLAGLLSGLQSFAETMEKVADKVEKKTDDFLKKTGDLGTDVFRVKEQQWYAVRALGLASPYPDFFRAVVHDWRGEAEEAFTYYNKAAANPNFPGFVFDFGYLTGLDFSGFVALSTRLKAKQAQYEGAKTRDSFYFDKDVPTWDAAALANKAAELLSKDKPDYTGAQDYLEAAVRVDPFDVKYVYFCAMIHAKLKDGVATARYLNEALKMDPDNEKLKAAVSGWNSNKEEKL